MLHRMVRVLVAGPREYFDSAVDVLYRAGTVHLEDAATRAGTEESSGVRRVSIPASGEVASLLLAIEGILARLPGPGPALPQEATEVPSGWRGEGVIARARALVEESGEKVEELTEEITAAELSITTLDRYRKVILRIRPVESLIPVLDGFEVTVLLIQKQYTDIIDLMRKTIAEITGDRSEIIATDLDEETIAAVTIFPKELAVRVHSFLFARNVNELRFPPDLAGIPFDEALEKIARRVEEERARIRRLQDRLAAISAARHADLLRAREGLADLKEEYSVFSHFAETDYTFLIQGWIPEKRFDATKQAIAGSFGRDVVLAPLASTPADEEKAPVLTNNPRIVRPFEIFLGLSGIPRYTEIDPTPFFALFFPIFFGVMVGDIGYGIVIFLIALVLRHSYGKKFPWFADLMEILMISSLPAVIFGVLYGELFGNLGEELGFIHPLTIFSVTWNRLEAIIPLLIGTILIGFLHVTVGLTLGIRNGLKEPDRRRSLHHIAERGGILLIIWGIWVAVLGVAHFLPGPALAAGGLLVLLGLPSVVIGGGVRGATDILGTIGNIFSYARLMAIGLASVILALVANTLGEVSGSLVTAVLIALPLHALNIILAMFSPFIHSMRLHIVEFFSKFFEGGGTRYAPFGARPLPLAPHTQGQGEGAGPA